MTYVSSAEARAYLRDTPAANVTEIDAALLAACNTIDAYCQRTFDVPTSATPRSFVAPWGDLLTVPDIANTTGLVVVDDGTTLTLGTDFQLEVSPGQVNQTGVDGRSWPYSYVRVLNNAGWDMPVDGEATITITARWGWPAVPDEVKLAAKLLTKDYFTARDLRHGFVDVGDFGRRVAANPIVGQLLAPLRRAESWGIA